MAVGTETPRQSVGAYELVDRIAEGGMGTVYKARHKDTAQLVAVKVLSPHLAKNSVLVQRFYQEYTAAKTINHANIVQALDFGRDGDSQYLVMEYVDGESLGQRLERDGRLDTAEALRIIGHVAQGLHRAHKLGMIHRDVKPDNILLTADGQVKLADLGLVKELETDNNLTRTGRGLGTPHFMAPEQFRDAKNASVRCDVYSLAATLYMMVTGELPFKAQGPLEVYMKKQLKVVPPRQLVPSLSERIDWAICRSMSVEPEMRASTCREFVEDLTGHSTRKLASGSGGIALDLWYLVHKDTAGVSHTVKGSTEALRRTLKTTLLGETGEIRASRSKSGPFEPLRHYPEFRDLVMPLTKQPRPAVTESTPLPENRLSPPAPAVSGDSTCESFARLLTNSANLPSADSEPRPHPAAGPHIDFGLDARRHDWLKWASLIFIAVLSGIAGYVFMN
jgi:eukaryotic-like serine/threonine-protein kinase